MADYIFLRSSGYYFRYARPLRFASVLPVRELRYPLHTHELRIAKRTAAYIVARIEWLLSGIENSRMRLSEEQIKSLVRKEVEETRQEIKADHLRQKSTTSWSAHVSASLELLQEAEEELAHSNFRNIARRAQQVLDDNGIQLDHQSDSFRLLCRELLRASIELHREDIRLHEGGLAFDEQPYLQLISGQPIIRAAEEKPKGPRLSEVLPLYTEFKVKSKDIGEASKSRYRDAVVSFVDVVGDKHVEDIAYRDAEQLWETLLKLPPNRKKAKAYRDKSVAEILAMDLPPEKCMKGATINNSLAALSEIFGWLLKQRLVTSNVFAGVTVSANDSLSYSAYTDEDLAVLTRSALYVDSQYSRKATTTAAHWWLPLLALWSGARAGELMQMHVSDIKTIDGILCATVDDEGEGKQLKTKAARRRFPIHSALLELGFEDYVEQKRKVGATRLLESFKTKGRKPGDAASSWFSRYRANFLPPEFKQEKKVLHSFRSTLITAARNAGADKRALKFAIGHQDGRGDTMDIHYDKGPGIAFLQQEIEKVRFPSVDLSALRYGWEQFKIL